MRPSGGGTRIRRRPDFIGAADASGFCRAPLERDEELYG